MFWWIKIAEMWKLKSGEVFSYCCIVGPHQTASTELDEDGGGAGRGRQSPWWGHCGGGGDNVKYQTSARGGGGRGGLSADVGLSDRHRALQTALAWKVSEFVSIYLTFILWYLRRLLFSCEHVVMAWYLYLRKKTQLPFKHWGEHNQISERFFTVRRINSWTVIACVMFFLFKT